MDVKSALVLNDILKGKDVKKSVKKLEKIIKGKKVFIYGAGAKDIKNINEFEENSCKIVADKALNFLNFQPDVVVTDLDGDLEKIIDADRNGSVVVVHAHGDNIDKLKFVKKLENVVGTCQVKPFGLLKNFGGFTDGDRAVFLAQAFKAKEINLVAFNFDNVYIYTRSKDIKLKKLMWAKRLIEYIKERGAKIWWR